MKQNVSGRRRFAFSPPCAAAAFCVVFLVPRAWALPPAPESGACSLENATPATVALVDEDFDLLLDDGRRAALAGLEFPGPPAKDVRARRAAAHKRLSEWLTGKDIFLGAFAGAADRWGRFPARVFAASGAGAEAPLVSVGAALLEEGLARFRPDPPAAPCARAYLTAEAPARDASRGLWADPEMRPIDAGAKESGAALLHRKGMAIVEGKIHGVGQSAGAIYLNFSKKRFDDFSVVISRRDLAILAASGIEPPKLIGRRARVRGLIETGFGPRMAISTPAEIEILDATP
ncbi:thermonuclease family protein [Methylocystis sp. Sn-Cys]|uniref:thermonuclease family protein n=1 Tax=Methylocystis sp. Sn-Cys TaxID=1701263 RepID=UPI001924998B|nr:thermonuclease family protein [Methylocystis sp. Sn-Cys]MBL1256525.1 thermonuclease family protein [Methylocystis sp. Sn-Cys]